MSLISKSEKMHRQIILVMICLTVLLLMVYWDLQDHDFINYDDPTYVTENYYVKAGLSREGISWAWRDTHTGYWHPLTWLSHMADFQLFGMRSGGHHWSSLLLHIANTLILFHIFRLMTGEPWKSAAVAGMFALHPLNVESVAWVAERKNVLSAFFWMTTLWAYIRYDRHPSLFRYSLVAVLFAAGLLSKPMVVTLPFVLLLMDFWPLQRIGVVAGEAGQPSRRPLRFTMGRRGLVMEKVPLLLLSFAVSGGTIWAVNREEGLASLDVISLGTRLAHALVSYVVYLGKLLWPVKLAVFYPHPMQVPLWQGLAAAVFLGVLTCACLAQLRRKPYLIVGWLWYLGVLFPVIGILQAGHQAMADRYAYLPFIGVFIMIVWGGAAFLNQFPWGKMCPGAAALVLIVFFALCTRYQLSYWDNSIRLFSRALAVTERNWVAHNNLGAALLKEGKIQAAIQHFEAVLRIKPDYTYAHNNMGLALTSQGSTAEAQSFYLEALRYRPNFVEAYNNIGVALTDREQYEEAVTYFRKALHYRPHYPEALNNLGYVHARQGRYSEAIRFFDDALRLKPDYVAAWNNAGSALAQSGRTEEGIERFRRALLIAPDDVMAHNNMGIALANLGRYEAAGRHFQEVVKIDPHHAEARKNLAYVRSKINN